MVSGAKRHLNKGIAVLGGIPVVVAVFFLLEKVPDKWIAMVLLACGFAAVAAMIGDFKRCFLFVLILGLPLGLSVRLISRDGTGLVDGVYLSVVDIAIIALILPMLVGGRSADDTGAKKVRFLARVTKPLLLFFGATILSFLVSSDKTWSVYGIVNAVKLLVLFFTAANSIRTEKDVKYVVLCLLASFFLQSALYIIQHFTGADFDVLGRTQSSHEFYGETRERGLMGQANTSGLFFSACLVLSLSWYMIERNGFAKALTGIAIGLGLWALTITLTRAGWLSFALSGGILIIIGLKRGWFGFRIVMGMMAIVVMIILGLWDTIGGRLEKSDAGAAYSRIPSIILMTRIIRDHPVLGVGVNTYFDVRKRYHSEDLKGALHYPHNQYLLVFVETGIIGFLGFMWFLYEMFRQGVKAIRGGDTLRSKLTAGVLMSILSICVGMGTISNVAGAVANLTWFLAGFMVSIVSMGGVCEEERKQTGIYEGALSVRSL